MTLCGVIATMIAGSLVVVPNPIIVPDGWQEPIRAAADDGPMTNTVQELAPLLMALPGVVGVGEGRCDGKPCFKVFVVEKTEGLEARIRDIARGEPLEIMETGEIRARKERD